MIDNKTWLDTLMDFDEDTMTYVDRVDNPATLEDET